MNEENKTQPIGKVTEKPMEVPEVPESELTTPTGTVPSTETDASGKMIWVLTIGAVFILLAVGGYYMWQISQSPVAPEPDEVAEVAAGDEESSGTKAHTTSSDTIVDIEADIEDITINDLDTEFAAIEAEIDAALSE